MPRTNRVDPGGRIFATGARGLLMGNRGRLHDPDGRLVRDHDGRRWISCLLAFRGRRRPLMQPGRYTELFFLDEATALAAGHRPCGECRRPALAAYRRALSGTDVGVLSGTDVGSLSGTDAGPLDLRDLDRLLDGERRRPIEDRPRVGLADLPAGAAVRRGDGHLVRAPDGSWRSWTPSGYREAGDVPATAILVTPPTSVEALRGGYAPLLHPTLAAPVGSPPS